MDTSRTIRPSVQRFQLGSFSVSTVLDGAHWREPLKPPFAIDKSDEDLAAIGHANHLPWDKFQSSYCLTVIDTGTERILIDTGFGSSGRDSGVGLLRDRLSILGLSPEDISIVALTHVHPDHILGIREGDSLSFPNARHMIGQREFDEWKRGDLIPPQRTKNREMFTQLIEPLSDRLTFLTDGQSLTSGVTAEAAFGHSVGHMMYRIESEGNQILVWGDLCNHFVFSLQHPESPVGYDDDKDLAIQSRLRVLDMAAQDGLLVAGFHMPFPSVGFVERSDDSYRWVPASYQIWD